MRDREHPYTPSTDRVLTALARRYIDHDETALAHDELRNAVIAYVTDWLNSGANIGGIQRRVSELAAQAIPGSENREMFASTMNVWLQEAVRRGRGASPD